MGLLLPSQTGGWIKRRNKQNPNSAPAHSLPAGPEGDNLLTDKCMLLLSQKMKEIRKGIRNGIPIPSLFYP